ncbi:sigma-70 family RNA polymerase sigma factor [Paramicrobacterium agarici]|uniref:sigma-70 family RNA polymerase sigma factor n=1 Tax=Paramicrobacterium agarici TaxID=630514 RepID=UPI00116EDC0B|nr:sigma-70 family RNA polymerase sigma factor [Microbacterium agarici]TQO24261.1 RNA polymerase sigma factor (sigma-70 family) [Microbacterium agarici]
MATFRITPEIESALSTRIKSRSSRDANRAVAEFLELSRPAAAKWARRLMRPGLMLSDLEHVALTGVGLATMKYDPTRGHFFPFAERYAMNELRAAAAKGGAVTIPEARLEELSKARKDGVQSLSEEAADAQGWVEQPPASLFAQVVSDGSDAELWSTVADPDAQAATEDATNVVALVADLLNGLDSRTQHALIARVLGDELARAGVTRENAHKLLALESPLPGADSLELPQADFAALLGVSGATASRLEKKAREQLMARAEQMREAFYA